MINWLPKNKQKKELQQVNDFDLMSSKMAVLSHACTHLTDQYLFDHDKDSFSQCISNVTNALVLIVKVFSDSELRQGVEIRKGWVYRRTPLGNMTLEIKEGYEL